MFMRIVLVGLAKRRDRWLSVADELLPKADYGIKRAQQVQIAASDSY
jgi:hypothetical protein